MIDRDGDMNWSALDAYLSGRCTPDEANAIERWAERAPSRAHLLASVRRIWDAAGVTPKHFDAEAAVRALRSARAKGSEITEIFPSANRAIPRWRPSDQSALWRPRRSVAPVAVAAALVAAIGISAWQWQEHLRATEVTSTSAHAREYATARGQRTEVMLTDGTRVWLSVDSRLRVPQDYGTTTRTVQLEGEGYFEVRHDAAHPFRVLAARAVAEDLGTKFVVRAYPEDTSAMVVVAEGSVALGSDRSPAGEARGVPLKRGQRGDIDGSGIVIVTPNVDVDAYLDWRNGRLELRHVPLVRAIRDLERWYGVTITLSDSSLAQISVKASFSNESLDDALDILASTLGIRYARQGTQVRLLSGDSSVAGARLRQPIQNGSDARNQTH